MRRAFLGATVLCGALGVIAACGGDDESPSDPVDGGSEGSLVDNTVRDTGSDTGSDAGIVDTGIADTREGGTTLDGGSCGGDAVAVTSVVPQFAWVDGKTALTISGVGFLATPKVFLRYTGGGDAGADAGEAGAPDASTYVQIQHVAFVSSTSLTAIIPANLVAVGTYELAVVNPNSCAGVVANGIRIVPDAPPLVTEVSPAAGTTQTDVPVTIKGCNFSTAASGLTVHAVSSTGQLTLMSTQGTATCTGGNAPECNNVSPLCTLSATIETKTKNLGSGAYAIRVTNTAPNTFGEYSVFVVTNPSGNLTGGWVAEDALVTGRRSLGLAAGRVNDASRFLYAIGGENAAGTALDTIDVGPLDRFGQLGTWFEGKNKLTVKRSGPAVARFGKWIYVIGGTSDTDGTKGAAPTGAPLASIDRAKILDPANAPVVVDPPSTDTTAGTLAKGTWYYKVSAIGSDTDDPSGESIESDEVVATLSAAGKVTLTWAGITGATGWKVYRSPAADGTSNSEVLLTTISVGATTSFVDDGTLTPGTERPMPIGSTGKFTATADVIGNRSNAAAVVALDPVGAPYLFLTGGWGHCGGGTGNAVSACVERAAITAGTGALGAFSAAGVSQLVNARMRHGVAVMNKDNGPSDFADGGALSTATFLFVAGGRDAAGAFDSGKNVEHSLIAAGGTIAVAFTNPGSFSNSRDGTQFQIANGYGYAFQGGSPGGGGNVNYSGTSDQGKTTVGTTAVTFPNWSNAGANLGSKVGRHGVVDESAYFYLVGGTSNDTDALNSVYRVLH